MERTADTLENCVTVLEEKSCEKQTARSDAELCTLYSALKYRVEVDQAHAATTMLQGFCTVKTDLQLYGWMAP